MVQRLAPADLAVITKQNAEPEAPAEAEVKEDGPQVPL